MPSGLATHVIQEKPGLFPNRELELVVVIPASDLMMKRYDVYL